MSFGRQLPDTSRGIWTRVNPDTRRSKSRNPVSSVSLSLALQGVSGTGEAAAFTFAQDVAFALTGSAATGTPGLLAPHAGSNATKALASAAAIASCGTLAPSLSSPASGIAGTATGGVFAVSADFNIDRTVTLATVAATGVQGTLGLSRTITLSSVAATAGAQALTVAATGGTTLTGVAATSAAGTLASSLSRALTGASATAAPGVFLVSANSNVATALIPATASGAVGSFAFSPSVALSGAGATTAAGTVTPGTSVSAALSGVSATGATGNLHGAVALNLTTTPATAAAGIVVVNIAKHKRVNTSVALVGSAGTGSPGTTRGNPGLALIGVSATTGQGSFAPISTALTAVTATGQVATTTPGVTLALSGVQASGGIGTIAVQANANVAVTVAAVSATSAVARFALSPSLTLSGIAATASASAVTATPGVTLSSVSATAGRGTLGLTASATITLPAIAAAATAAATTRALSKTLSGINATATATAPTPNVTSALSGVFATGIAGMTPNQAGQQITTLSLINTTGATRINEPFTYGLIFKDGDILSGQIPQLKANGVALAAQSIDHVTAWPSGAMKRCLVSGILPSLSPGGQALTINTTIGAPNTSGLTLAAFQSWATANSWNVSWEATVAGTLFTADANTALAGSTTFSNSAAHYAGQWMKNNLCTEFICSVPLKTSGAVQHRILRAFFHIRAYHPGGTIQDVRADAFLQNGDVNSIGNGFVLFDTLVLKQNGSQVWSRTTRSPAADLTVPGTPVDPNTTISVTASASVFTASDVGRLIESNGGLCLISSQAGSSITGLMFYGDGSPLPSIFSATLARAQAIATGSGTISLNGVDDGMSNFAGCVRSGTAYIRAAGLTNVRLYSASGHAGIVYTVNGTRRDGTTTAETITGSAATFALGAVAWDTITSITYTGGAAQTVSVGQGGLPASVTNGTWRVVGFYMPSRTRTRNFRTWHATGTRNAPQYDTTYLIGTKQIPNYDFAVRSAGQWATLDATNLTTLNGYPTSSGSSLFPDSADYNLNPNNEFNYFGYQCHQGNGGAYSERAVFGPYEVTWLNQMTANAWRNMVDRAISVFAWPVWMMDENTGKAVDPADRTTLSTLHNSSSAVFPVFVNIDEMQLVIDEIEHMGAKAAMMAYLFTGDMCWHEGYQYESMAQWMAFNPGIYGIGYTRNTMFPSERGMAWRLRHMAQLLAWYPDTMPAGFQGIQPKATIQAMFEGGTSTTGLIQNMNTAVTTGSDLSGITPAQKGDWHYITPSATGPDRQAAFQMSYLSMVLGHAYDNQVLGASGQNLFTYQASLPVALINDTASVHPRYFSAGSLGDNWEFVRSGVGHNGTPFASIAAGYAELRNNVFPTNGQAVNGSRAVPVATTLTATSGASVTMAFGTTQVLSGSDMVGAQVADAGTGRGTITAVASDGKSCTVNIPGGTPFSGTSLGANIVLVGAPPPGPNTGATMKILATETGYLEAAYDLYGALASIASLPAQNTAASTAHANVKTWMQNDSFYLASSWSFEAAQYMILPR